MSVPDCTCTDRMAAETGIHESTCPMSVTHTGRLWFRPSGGDWQTAPFAVSRSAVEERLHAELTALRQQVAELRAALEELDAVIHLPWPNTALLVRVTAMNAAMERAVRVLDATQPQEVQE